VKSFTPRRDLLLSAKGTPAISFFLIDSID
jgi:hypothetical protein